MTEFHINLVIYFITGTIGASFIRCLVDRSFTSILKRSYCDQCHTSLKIRQLVPILSSLICRWKCYHCSHKPAFSYGLGELYLGILCAANYVIFGSDLQGLLIQCLLFTGFLLSLEDWKKLQISVISAILFIIKSIIWACYFNKFWFLQVLILSVLTLSIYFIGKLFYKVQALGGGDIIVLIISALWIKIESLP